MEGEHLLQSLIQAIGLPESFIQNELDKILERNGLQKKDLTLDQLRPALAELVQEILLENKRALK